MLERYRKKAVVGFLLTSCVDGRVTRDYRQHAHLVLIARDPNRVGLWNAKEKNKEKKLNSLVFPQINYLWAEYKRAAGLLVGDFFQTGKQYKVTLHLRPSRILLLFGALQKSLLKPKWWLLGQVETIVKRFWDPSSFHSSWRQVSCFVMFCCGDELAADLK